MSKIEVDFKYFFESLYSLMPVNIDLKRKIFFSLEKFLK